MIKLLEKILVNQNDPPAKQRQSYGMLCGIAGILFNMLLFAGKFAAGGISRSIAITADAFNNLSDAGSSVVTLVGFKMAGTKPDTEHPYGHGRIEYIAGLIVAAAILIMAFELIRDSVVRILHPAETEFSVAAALVLAFSILIKLYMAFYNRRIGIKIDSAAMKAAATDSLSDALATSAVLLTALMGCFWNVHLDGYCGALVGAFIFFAGISAAKDTLNPLLGQPPEESFVNEIYRLVMAHEEVLGVHDLIVHDYGPGRQMVSLHAEVSADENILEIHDLIDRIESEMKQKLYCETVIHMDPIVVDEETERMRRHIAEMVRQLGDGFSMHDFRMAPGKTHTNLIFDVVAPFECRRSDEEVIEMLEEKVKEKTEGTYYLKVRIDRACIKYKTD